MKKLVVVLGAIAMMFLLGADCGSSSSVKTNGKKGSPCETATDCNDGLDCWGFNHKCEDFSKLRERRKK